MIKRITCIECPVGCSLVVDIENCRVIKVKGNKCPKGEVYAVSEAQEPKRVLTSSVLACGLELKMVPVRTEEAIPKDRLMEGMEAIKKMRIKEPLEAGGIVDDNFLGLGVKLIATRGAI